MKEFKLEANLVDVIKDSGFTISEIQHQDGKYYVKMNKKVSRKNIWNVTVYFDGITDGFVDAVRQMIDEFVPCDSESQWQYEDFCFLFENLQEAFCVVDVQNGEKLPHL